MTAITEDYVSFETAKLLKEKGFDEFTLHYYDKYNDIMHHPNYYVLKNSELDGGISIPTLQMTMKWLREEHHIAINIGWGEIFEEQYQWWCIGLNMDNGNILYETNYHTSYEEACEVAIKYCLENLI